MKYPLTYFQIKQIESVLRGHMYAGRNVSLDITIGTYKHHLEWSGAWFPSTYATTRANPLELVHVSRETTDWRSGALTSRDLSEEEFDDYVRPVLDLALLAS